MRRSADPARVGRLPGLALVLPQLPGRHSGARGRETVLRCRLRNCTYRDSVMENHDVVCTLHRGITRGLLDALEPAARLAGFIPHDPETTGCAIEIDGPAPVAEGHAG